MFLKLLVFVVFLLHLQAFGWYSPWRSKEANGDEVYGRALKELTHAAQLQIREFFTKNSF